MLTVITDKWDVFFVKAPPGADEAAVAVEMHVRADREERRMNWRLVVLAVVAALALCAQSAPASIIPTGTTLTIELNDANYDPSDDCEGGITPGGTWLDPLAALSPNNAYTSSIVGALNEQFGTNTDDPAFTIEYEYTVSPISLAGTLLIDWYVALDDEYGATCWHGAEIVAYYDLGPDEDLYNLDWIQVYDESGDAEASGYEYTVDGLEDGNPAYYTPGENPWSPAGYTLDTTHDMTWTDGPGDPHPESDQWIGGVEFYMFLAGFGDPYPDLEDPLVLHQDVIIFDGILWGYDGICTIVPEPGTLGLMALGLAMGAVRAVKRR